MSQSEYFIYNVQSDPDDREGIAREIYGLYDELRYAKSNMTPAEISEKYGEEIANWIFFTNLDTLKIKTRRTKDGKTQFGLYGDRVEFEPIY